MPLAIGGLCIYIFKGRASSRFKQRGTNKAEVSEKMGKAKQNFKSLLTNPKWDSLELVCKAIGIEPWQLFEQEIMAAGYRLTAESKQQPEQPQEKDVEEFSYQDGQQQEEQQMRMHLRGIGDIDVAMPPAPPEKPAASEQQPQGTTLVGLVRCPQCGHSIRLFAEE